MKTKPNAEQPRYKNKIVSWLGSNWGIALLMALTTLVVLSGVLIFHKTTFFTNLDNVDQFYTWYQKLATSWHDGYLPIWNANIYAGSSFAAELQQGVLYPVNWLWVGLFGSATGISELALNYLVAFHFWLGSFGCYLLLKQMGAKKWSAYLSGITFAFSGAMAFRSISQTVIFFALAFLPYPLYYLIKAHEVPGRSKRSLIIGGVFLGTILLVGHIQPFFHTVLALIVIEAVYLSKRFVSVAKLKKDLLPALKRLLVIGIVGLIIAGPQLWISASYLPNAHRVQASGYAGPGEKIGYGEFSKPFNLEFHEFSNLYDPVAYPIRDGNNIFIGLAPITMILLIALVAHKQLKEAKLYERHSRLITTLMVLSILAMLGYATWFAVVLYKFPFVYQIRQLGRYAIIFNLGLAMLLAATLEVFANLKLSKKQVKLFGIIGLYLLINFVYLLLLHKKIYSLHHALHMGLAGLVVSSLLVARTRSRQVIITVIVIASAVTNGLWYLPRITAETKTAGTYKLSPSLLDVLDDTEGKQRIELLDDAVPMNAGNVYDLQTVGGYSATIYSPYYRITRLSGLDKGLLNDLLGVSLIVTKTPPVYSENLVYSDSAKSIYVIKRPTALPKMFTVDSPNSSSRAHYLPLPVITEIYEDNYQKFTVTVGKDDEVILSELYYPGWKAYIDGRETEIKNYAVGTYPLLKAINIPKGTHTVELRYHAFGLF